MTYSGKFIDVENLAPATVEPGPLEGVTVLDISTMMAAPWAATYMADFGADVVKAELPVTGDPMRKWGTQHDGSSLAWKGLSRNKRHITLALNTTAGQELLLRLVPKFDVLVENFRPGVMERWGLSPERLHEANPRLIILRTTGYGQTGPWAEKPGFGTLAEAFSGLANMTGPEDRPPVLAGYPVADGVAALSGVMGILAALYWRDVRGGTGQVIDNAIVEANFRLIDYTMRDFEREGIVRQRAGNRLQDLAPRNSYETADERWVAVSGGTQRVVRRLFEAMGQPGLMQDARFRDNAARISNVEELDEIIGAWIIERTVDEVIEIFEKHGVAGAPVNDTSQIAAHPHFRARDLLLKIDDSELGLTSTTHVHPRLSKTPGGVWALGGPVGADNESFFLDEVGLAPDEYDRLRSQGVI